MVNPVHVVHEFDSHHLVAQKDFEQGELILKIKGELVKSPAIGTLQVGPNLHIQPNASYSSQEVTEHCPWRFLNHACEPNTIIRGLEVYALRSIKEGEELTFNYNTTERSMAEPFQCNCGSSSCRGMIRGFQHLSRDQQEFLRPYLAPHLLAILGSASGAMGG